LRLSKETARALGRIRMAVFFPVHPFDFRVLPAAVSVLASGAIVALCMRAFTGLVAAPPEERSILVTVVERTPELENPRERDVIPSEPRAEAVPAEVPPPPARDATGTEMPALVLRLARRVDTVAAVPAWIESPLAPAPRAGAAGGELAAFWQQVRQRIAAKAVYPPAAVLRNAAGQVVLRVRIGPRGELMQAGIAASSSDGALDRAALSAVRDAAPFPFLDLARATGTNALEALIPVRFELVDGPAGAADRTMPGMR
jgi:TonB family protein